METFEIGLKDDVSPGANTAADSVSKLIKSMTGLSVSGKELTWWAQGFGDLGGMLAEVAPVAVVAGGALLAMGAAAAAAAVEGAKLAIEAAELKEKLTTTFDALSGGKGTAILATLDGMRAKLGMTREELAPVAEQLLALGVPVEQLGDKLTAIASIKALGITGGVEAFTKVLEKLQGHAKVTAKDLFALEKGGVNLGGVMKKYGVTNLDALAKALAKGKISATEFQDAISEAAKASGAKALEAQANSLGAQWALFKENISHLFEDVNVKPFLDGLKSVLGLFDQSTASGRTMKLLITQAFNAIFAVASKVFPYIKAFMLGLAIGALKIYIALKPTIAQLQKLFSGGADKGSLDFVTSLGESIKFIAPLIEMAAAGFIRFAEMAKAGIARAEAIFAFVDRVKAFVEEIKGVLTGGGSSAGDGLVSGIVNGIIGKTGSVYAALKQLAAGAIDTLKGALKISSPSKVTEELGKHTVSGFAGGIDRHSDKVDDAWGSAVGAFDMPKGPPSGGGGGGGKQITINVGGVVINGAGKSLEEVSEESLSSAYERLALMQGAL